MRAFCMRSRRALVFAVAALVAVEFLWLYMFMASDFALLPPQEGPVVLQDPPKYQTPKASYGRFQGQFGAMCAKVGAIMFLKSTHLC